MYRPSKKKVQSGGDYISSMIDEASLTMSTISKETLSTIAGMSNVTSFDQLATLSISQINSLIDAVNTQIATENTQITTNQTQIASIQSDIDRIPGGYQNAYDIANQQYISVQTAYNQAQATLSFDQSTLSTKIGQLHDLSSLSSFYTSSLYGYQSEYSSIWNTIQTNNATIAADEIEYQDKLRVFQDYQTRYETASYNLQSTLDALKYNSSLLSTATYDYFSTSSVYGYLIEDYINFSTNNLSISKYQFMSTNTYLTSLLAIQSTQLGYYVSTSTALKYANLNVDAARAASDYDSARKTELAQIIKYNEVEVQIRKIFKDSAMEVGGQQKKMSDETKAAHGGGFIDQTGGGYDLAYYASLTPPPGQELAYQTLYIMLSSMSSMLFSTAQVTASLKGESDAVDLYTLKAILDIADDNISTAQYTYYLAQLNQSSVISTMSGLSTRIAYADFAEQEYLSTLSSLSSIYIHDMATYNATNEAISSYLYIENMLSTYLRSTLRTISLLSTQSSMYNISVANFMQAYQNYSTLEGIAQSSIDGYSSIKGYMISSIDGLDGEIGGLEVTVGNQFIDLNGNAAIFYNNVRTDLNNNLDAYKYGVQEWNSFIGYIASELLIQKLNLYTAIDSVTFSLQGNITEAQKSILVGQRGTYGSLQTTIQGIITVLNGLDSKFATLLQLIETERADKGAFVSTRATMTDYEITVLQDPTKASQVQGQYVIQLGNLNTRVGAINTDILNRNQQMIALNVIMGPQLAILQSLNLFSYVVPDAVPTNIGPFNLDMTEYALLPQLNYNLSQSMYPYVLTNQQPAGITGTGTLPSAFY